MRLAIHLRLAECFNKMVYGWSVVWLYQKKLIQYRYSTVISPTIFLRYHRGDWYCLRWELIQYLDDVIVEVTVFLGSLLDFWKFRR
jgi:hypothetical protein